MQYIDCGMSDDCIEVIRPLNEDLLHTAVKIRFCSGVYMRSFSLVKGMPAVSKRLFLALEGFAEGCGLGYSQGRSNK